MSGRQDCGLCEGKGTVRFTLKGEVQSWACPEAECSPMLSEEKRNAIKQKMRQAGLDSTAKSDVS